MPVGPELLDHCGGPVVRYIGDDNCSTCGRKTLGDGGS
jgi:hypothetical protein